MSQKRDIGTFGADLTAGQKPGKSPPGFSGLSRPGTAGHFQSENSVPIIVGTPVRLTLATRAAFPDIGTRRGTVDYAYGSHLAIRFGAMVVHLAGEGVVACE